MLDKDALEDEVYAVKEIATILKVSTATVYDVIDDKRLRAFRVNRTKGAYRITRQALLDFIKGQEDVEENK